LRRQLKDSTRPPFLVFRARLLGFGNVPPCHAKARSASHA
jgi:hypothetical protein